MKAKTTILASLLVLAGAASGDDVAVLEGKLKADILDKVDQANPVDPATGARKFISFAMISDIHKCRRVEGDDAATDPVTTYWYGSASCLTEAEQSIRLLGSLSTEAGLDAVINGGDLSTAPIYNGGAQDRGLTEAEYTNEIWNVKAMFDQYIPASVPLFTIDGNHERNYSLNGADMHMSDEAWAYVQTNFNTSAAVAHAHNVDVTYHRDLASAKLGANETGRFTGNSFHLDFRRLLASGGSNVRIACVSLYDGAAGGESQYRVFDAGQFYDAAGNLLDADLTPENTVMGMVAHGAEEKVSGVSGRSAAGSLQCGFMNGWSNPANKTGAWNLGTHPGKAFFGLVAAHFHFTNEKQITDAYDTAANPGNAVYASAVSVASAYAVNCPSKPKSHELGTEAAYHFSIFVVDTDANKFREIRVGGWSGTYPNPHEDPVVQLHETNIRTHLEAPPAPTLGEVTVEPGVTSATVSGTIAFPGTGATACDAYLAWGTDASNLPPPTRIAEGATASFGYTISDLTAETVFYYALSVSNNAATPMGAATSGSFTTLPASGDILPGETPEETRKTIQDAIDAAANLAEPGTVTLAAGLFEIDAQLMVTGGVTLAGQGMDLTAIRQTESGLDKRVMTVDGGSTVERLTITGGRPTQTTMEDGSVENNWNNGAGAHVVDGTISWCCISNNAAPTGNDNYGGGVFIRKGRIDHSIVADNRVATTTGTQAFGGGIAARLLLGPVAIDSCLVCGNSATNNAGTGFGGGIAVEYLANDRSTAVTVLNTTIVGNSAGAQDSSGASEGGAVYAKVSSYPDQANGFSMMDCIVAGNATAGTNATVSVSDPSKIDWCLFDVADDKLGDDSLVGAPAFVDAANGDYRPAWNSPAVGGGETYEGIGTDLAGAAFAEIPSMGCYEYGELAETPAFDIASGATFYPTTNATISCATADAKIFYTTDGSRPTAASTPYAGPIELSATTTIKARAYAEGLGPSAVAAATYTLKRPAPKPTDFAKSVKITMPTALCPNEITTGVPALIRLGSTINGFAYDDFSLQNGGDMMFVDANGDPLPHEVDTWDEDGESLVWVRLPSTAAGTTITMYYGNGAVSPAEPEEVWSGYVGVWHLNEASGDAQDATGHGLVAVPTGTNAVADSVGIACQVGNGRQMATAKGNQSYLSVADDALLDCGDSLTFSGWFKATDTFANYSMRYVSRKNDYRDANGWEVEAQYSTNPDNSATMVSARAASDGKHETSVPDIREHWLHLSLVYNHTRVTFYVNGVEKGSIEMSGATAADNDLPLAFGNNATGTEANWVGFMDELRLSADPASADYAIAEYKAMDLSGADVFAYGDARNVGDGVIHPRETPEKTRRTIQDAIDEAAAMSPAGTVTLGEGLFDIDAMLNVTGGVTLVGQGWTNTTVRFAGTSAGASNRVMTVSGGSVVGHLAMTGGKVNHNAGAGGGAIVDGDGTIAWCCVTNNYSQRNYGGGVYVVGGGTVRIDHTIVAGNSAGTAYLNGAGGGICIRGWDGLRVEIESCLVYGNVAGGDGRTSPGGGIYVGVRDARTDHITTVIRNTTVADNQVLGSGPGGGLYVDQADTTLVNCLFSDNAADTGDGNVAVAAAVADDVAAKTSNCLFGNGTAVFGANPVGIAGSAGFVAVAAGDYHLVDTSLVMDKGADYAGIGTDLDGRAYAWPPSIGCYEYGSGVRPPDEWDVPGPNGGGIKGFDDGNGGSYVTFTSIERSGGTIAVGFAAAKISASVGDAYALLCKESLADTATFALSATITEAGDALATLEAATDRPTLFAVGIATAEE